MTLRPRYKVDLKPWKELVNLVEKTSGRRVRVGLFEGRLALIGLYHEYGTKTIPARPWLRSTMEGRRADIAAFQARIAKLLLTRKISSDRAMALLGAYIVSLVKEQITVWGPLIFVPLKPETIRRKGGNKSTPLVHTGQMLNAITFVVA